MKHSIELTTEQIKIILYVLATVGYNNQNMIHDTLTQTDYKNMNIACNKIKKELKTKKL